MSYRVLQILPSLDSSGGGVQRGAIDMANALVKAGHQSFMASAGGDRVPALTRAGTVHLELPLDSKNLWRMRWNAKKLVRLSQQHGIQLLHARSRAPAWSAYWASQRLGIPFLTTFHGTYGHQNRLKRAYNAVMVRGQLVIAVSEHISQHIQAVYGVDAARIRVIHRGVDLSQFDPARVSASRIIQLAKAWQLPDGVPVVMLPGRLTRWKGHMLLLQALARLGSPNICCVMVGGDEGRGAYRQELLQQIQTLGLTGQVKLVGACQDMPAAYRLADVVVVPSLAPEAFGRTMAEGLAMGPLVIAANHGAAPEVLDHGRHGWLFAPKDATDLAGCLQSALEVSTEERLGRAVVAARFVADHFSLTGMTEQTLAVYEELLRS